MTDSEDIICIPLPLKVFRQDKIKNIREQVSVDVFLDSKKNNLQKSIRERKVSFSEFREYIEWLKTVR